MFSLESFHRKYESDVSELNVQGRAFRLFIPRSIETFIDDGEALGGFPLRSKIWEASLVLADELAGRAPKSGCRILEIGGGIGLVSVVARCFGHDIVMTEHNPHALEYARANAQENACPDLRILDLDWNTPELEGMFDCIVGSEVVYHERDYEPLERLFGTLLKPGGEIILSEGIRKSSMAFFARMQARYQAQGMKKVLRSRGKEIPVILCRMRRVQ